MKVNQIEKRKEPRIPIHLEGYLRKSQGKYEKKCHIKDISLHGAQVLLDEPLNREENVLVEIKNNGYSYETIGTVRWCKNGTLPYRIGLYFKNELNIAIPVKEILSSIKDAYKAPYKQEYTIQQLKSTTYLDLMKNSVSKIHLGYMCLFLKNEIVNLFQTINTEINLVDYAVSKILKIVNNIENDAIKNVSSFFYEHFKNLNSELNKIRTFIKILDKEIKEVQNQNINLVEINKILASAMNDFYQNICTIKQIDCCSNISKSIPPFIGNTYLIEKALGMIFTFHTNYILFYKANIINVFLNYIEPSKEIIVKFTNNGSKMFNEDIFINKDKVMNKNFQNKFLNYLAFIVLILEEYNPEIKIINESGNNQFILSLSIDPIIIES